MKTPEYTEPISKPRSRRYPNDSATRRRPGAGQADARANVAANARLLRILEAHQRRASQTKAGAAATPGKTLIKVPGAAAKPSGALRPENHHKAPANPNNVAAKSDRATVSDPNARMRIEYHANRPGTRVNPSRAPTLPVTRYTNAVPASNISTPKAILYVSKSWANTPGSTNSGTARIGQSII